MAWLSRFLIGIGSVVALTSSGSAQAASQLCEQPGTVLLWPEDGGSMPASSALVLIESGCVVPAGVPAPELPVFIAAEHLQVEIDGQPATLVRVEESRTLWRLEPEPSVGAVVTITGCDGDDRTMGRCWLVTDEVFPPEPLIEWSFAVEPESAPPALVEPTITRPVSTGMTDAFSDPVMTLWSFTVERGEADPGHPMVLQVSLDPGDASAELVWLGDAVRGEDLVLGSVEDEEVCARARTFDTRGGAGPTATACSEPTGCGCTSVGAGARSWAVLALLLVLLRRRRGASRVAKPDRLRDSTGVHRRIATCCAGSRRGLGRGPRG